MATMTNDTTNNLWVLEQTVSQVGTFTDLITTENKFVDKNISVRTIVPAAGTPTLSITDQGSTNISVGSVSSGYYPLSTSLTGTMSYATAGWSTTSGASATDSTVVVGRINQSTLQKGVTAISSGATVTPEPGTTQTITIGAGYYDTDRTITIDSMSSGTPAAATVTVSGTAPNPGLSNTTSGINGKTQVIIADNTIVTSSSSLDSAVKYYISLSATAPALTLAAANFSKIVDTVGYLGPTGPTSQITASGSIAASTTQFFAPITSGAVTVTAAKQATAPELTTYTTEGGNAGVNIGATTGIVGTPQATEPTSGLYVAFTANAPATTLDITKAVNTNGWIGSIDQITASASTTANTKTWYTPIQAGALSAGAGSASANGNITLGTATTTQPSTGKYISATGSGTVSVGTAGYLAAGTSQTSNSATTYYPVPSLSSADFNVVSGNQIKSTSAGWLDANVVVGSVDTGTISTGTTSKSGYTNNTTAAVPANGYLYINAGYFPNTQISLATLIPDSNTTDALNNNILAGYEAFDTAGNRLVGTIATYDGSYTATWS